MGAVLIPRGTAFAQSGAASAVTATTSETTLATITIPAGFLGANGQIQVVSLWSYTNSANNKILRMKFGGSAVFALTSTTTSSLLRYDHIWNRNSVSAQSVMPTTTSGTGNSGTALVSLAVDTAAAVDLIFTGQLANSGETITLEGYLINVWPKT